MRILAVVVTLSFSVVGFPAIPCWAQTTHVQELEEMKTKWPEMAADERVIKLEGRFSGRAGQLLNLQNSDLVYRVEKGVLLPKLKNGHNVELVGYLRKNSKGIGFVVQRIAAGTDDSERLEQDRRRLPERDAQARYGLAKWAAKRAAFYDDAELLKQSQAIVVEAFEIERTSIEKGDSAGLRRLADRITVLGLETRLRTSMIHESLRWRWDAMTTKGKNKQAPPFDRASREKFLEVLEKELNGSTQPVRLADRNLARDYKQNPQRVYEAATLSNQLLLHRFFYREVLLPLIVADAKPDGSNGDVIAMALKKNIPEEAELASEYEASQLQYRVSTVESQTRSQMLELTEFLQRTNQKKLANDTTRRWVVSAEKRLVSRGPAGMVQAASEYNALLGDQKNAVRLLKRAWAESDEKEEIEERLQRYDVYRRDDSWMSQAQVDSLPENQMDIALREGRVIPGMNTEQVRKTLGKPDRVTRFATSTCIHITWSFLDSSNRIVVLFERRPGSAKAKTKVISVSTVPSR